MTDNTTPDKTDLGDAGDALDYSLDHIDDSFERTDFLEAWREDYLDGWPDYAKWLAVQRAGAAANTRPIEAEEASSRVLQATEYLSSIDDPVRITNARGEPFLAYTGQQIVDAFKAGCLSASPIPVTPDEGLADAVFFEKITDARSQAAKGDFHKAYCAMCDAMARVRHLALCRSTEAADETRALLSELRELLRQTTNVLALSDKNDPTECIADNGMTVWDGIRLEYERLWPQTTAALSCIDAHLQGPDTDGGQS